MNIRKIVPTDKIIKQGQKIMYNGIIHTRKTTKTSKIDRQTITGTVEYVTPYVVGVREPKGQLQTFTAVDLFTGDVVLVNSAEKQFSLLLGLQDIVS